LRSGKDPGIKYGFAGHETFPFRYTWLPKGIGCLLEHPDLFTQDDALVMLGVGKNMVRSIRHWCVALDVIEPEGRRGMMRPTGLGLSLFGDEGWDPYLEDTGTLWLLHWKLAGRPRPASTWHLAFTRWSTERFVRDVAKSKRNLESDNA
jgi:hypothetical protein